MIAGIGKELVIQLNNDCMSISFHNYLNIMSTWNLTLAYFYLFSPSTTKKTTHYELIVYP